MPHRAHQLRQFCDCGLIVHTVQAGSEEDVGLAAGSADAAATDRNESLSSFLVCLVEASDPPQGATAETHMALVGVETSTGTVLYDDFKCAFDAKLCWPGLECRQAARHLHAPASMQSSSVFKSAACRSSEAPALDTLRADCCLCRDGPMRGGLEARMMFTAPSELLVAEPLSQTSKRLLGSYASASRRLRSESVPAEKFRRPEALRDLDAFYAAGASCVI